MNPVESVPDDSAGELLVRRGEHLDELLDGRDDRRIRPLHLVGHVQLHVHVGARHAHVDVLEPVRERPPVLRADGQRGLSRRDVLVLQGQQVVPGVRNLRAEWRAGTPACTRTCSWSSPWRSARRTSRPPFQGRSTPCRSWRSAGWWGACHPPVPGSAGRSSPRRAYAATSPGRGTNAMSGALLAATRDFSTTVESRLPS